MVTLGIWQKYGTKVDAEKGRSFFDKIIQLPFKMPVAQYDVRNYVQNMLTDQEIHVNKEDLNLYVNLLRTSTGFNPRSMKRVFNTFQLLNMISGGMVRDVPQELRERVLFAIICAQMKYDKFYQYLVSGRIMGPEDLEALKNPAQGEAFIHDFLADSSMDAETRNKQMRRLSLFMGFFIQALQMDNDEKLSQEEFDNLNRIIKNSLITSLGDESEYASDDVEQEYRKINREYAEKIKSQLDDLPQNDKAQSKILLPRRRGESIYRYSDVCYQYIWKNWDGCWVTFECQFSRWKPTNVLVRYSLTFNSKKSADELHEKLGDNPLGFAREPEWKQINSSRIGYFYPEGKTINDNDDIALEAIAGQIRKWIALLQKQLAEAEKA